MAAIDKVRVIVAGDSGVGKSSLVHLISQNEVIKSPSWTIGCAVEVKLHEYKEGTPQQKTYFIELWDLGGSNNHRNTRSVFYTPTHGIILVHDLTNKKSKDNLQKWLGEILDPDNIKSDQSSFSQSFDNDPETFFGATQIPILIVGTKPDLIEDFSRKRLRRGIAEQCGSDELLVDCLDSRSLAAGSSNAVILSRFFDKVIERKYFSRDSNTYADKRKHTIYNSFLSPKFYHMD